jgi:hypothetical protein
MNIYVGVSKIYLNLAIILCPIHSPSLFYEGGKLKFLRIDASLARNSIASLESRDLFIIFNALSSSVYLFYTSKTTPKAP